MKQLVGLVVVACFGAWSSVVAAAAVPALGDAQPVIPGAEPAWQLPAGVPPSPSTATGERIWPDPRFTHWPAVVYVGEERNCSFSLPVRAAGVAGWIRWADADLLPFVLPTDTDQISGLLALPQTVGVHAAQVGIAERTWDLALRVADVREPWPLAALKDGFPVDADGVPVVLLDQRRDPSIERQWKFLVRDQPRGQGPAVVVGDPLESGGSSVFAELPVVAHIAIDLRRGDHAALVALAPLLTTVPKTVIWSPGNANLFLGTWTAEEERVLGAVRSRCAAMGAQPQLVLLLPPVPVDEELRELATKRRELLARSAAFQGWQIIDVEQIAGPAVTANRVADGVFTRYPLGPAQAEVRAALTRELTR